MYSKKELQKKIENITRLLQTDYHSSKIEDKEDARDAGVLQGKLEVYQDMLRKIEENTEKQTVNLSFPLNDGRKYYSIESKHLSFLLFFKRLDAFLINASLLDNKDLDVNVTLGQVLFSFKSEYLEELGYKKNINSLNKLNEKVRYLQGEILKVAMVTLEEDIHTHPDLTFLKVK